MEKYDYLVILYDYYQNLLTDLQRKIFEYYYFDNYSLTEISELCDVSRNAVFDQIKRTTKILKDYEEKLGLNKKLKNIENLPLEDNIKEAILNILKE